MRPLRAGIFLKAVGPVPHPRRTSTGPSARFVRAPKHPPCHVWLCVWFCALYPTTWIFRFICFLVFSVVFCALSFSRLISRFSFIQVSFRFRLPRRPSREISCDVRDSKFKFRVSCFRKLALFTKFKTKSALNLRDSSFGDCLKFRFRSLKPQRKPAFLLFIFIFLQFYYSFHSITQSVFLTAVSSLFIYYLTIIKKARENY